jgi:filamentous hemagglutinin family protein
MGNNMNSTPTRAVLPSQQLHAEAARVASWRFGAMLPSGSKKLLLRPLTLAVSLAFGGMHAQTLAQSVVLADGKTATTVNKQGSTLDVSTGTVSGNRAFNSFSRFEVGQGDILNLRLPDGTNTLVNMVYDRPIRIDGILNSIQNNQIGGKVIFADPFGMVVGRTGVLNVGSLFVTTPTAQAMLGVIGANGQVNNAAAQDLIDGKLPQAAGSLIRIDGRINALERIRLQAEQVQVGQGAVVLAGADARHQAAFVSAVNTQGLEAATGMVDKGGVIEIVGKSLVVAGTLNASGAQGGGTIRLGRVGEDLADQVRVEASGKLLADAAQNGDGGTIDVWGTQANSFLGVISAKGGAQGGNGGFAEVSAKTGLVYDGAANLSAPSGKTGTLLIDPDTVCIQVNATDACAGGSVVTFSSINRSLFAAHF